MYFCINWLILTGMFHPVYFSLMTLMTWKYKHPMSLVMFRKSFILFNFECVFQWQSCLKADMFLPPWGIFPEDGI